MCRRLKQMAAEPLSDCQQASLSGPRCLSRWLCFSNSLLFASLSPVSPSAASIPHIFHGQLASSPFLSTCHKGGLALDAWSRQAGLRDRRGPIPTGNSSCYLLVSVLNALGVLCSCLILQVLFCETWSRCLRTWIAARWTGAGWRCVIMMIRMFATSCSRGVTNLVQNSKFCFVI